MSRILTRDELLELPVDIYNKALVLTREQNGTHKISNPTECEYCGRYINVLSCICDEDQAKWERTLQEVRDISNRDRSGE